MNLCDLDDLIADGIIYAREARVWASRSNKLNSSSRDDARRVASRRISVSVGFVCRGSVVLDSMCVAGKTR